MSARHRVEAWIEYLIAMLDTLDGDADLETEPDLEPDYRRGRSSPDRTEAFVLSNHVRRESWPPLESIAS